MRQKLRIVVMTICAVMLFVSCGNASSTAASSSTAVSSEEVSSSKLESVDEKVTAPSSEEIIEEVEPVEPPDGDFRVGFWGDHAEMIKQYETADFVGEVEGCLIYTGDVAGYAADILYYFDEAGVLYQGIYGLTETYQQGASYINRYTILKDSLTSKYGEPKSDEIITLSHLAEYTDAGTALDLGYTAYRTKWTTDDTEIMMALMNETGDITFVIVYSDINHEEVHNAEGL